MYCGGKNLIVQSVKVIIESMWRAIVIPIFGRHLVCGLVPYPLTKWKTEETWNLEHTLPSPKPNLKTYFRKNEPECPQPRKANAACGFPHIFSITFVALLFNSGYQFKRFMKEISPSVAKKSFMRNKIRHFHHDLLKKRFTSFKNIYFF